jgi:hypothetical protein
LTANLPGVLFVQSALLLLASCGYVGDPLPPALNIPEAISNLQATQRGDKVELTFTVPAQTTDGIGLRLQSVELRAASREPGTNPDSWSDSSEAFEVSGAVAGEVTVHKLPIAMWTGKHVSFAVRVQSHKNKWSAWSNLVSLDVVSEVRPPVDVRAEAAPAGVRLSWRFAEERPGRSVRVWKKAPGEPDFVEAAIVESLEWIDTGTQFGQPYEYVFQSLAGPAESVRTSRITIVPEDRFPPAAPTRVTAIAGLATVELAWEPSPEADFASYRVYRATTEAAPALLAADVATPSFRDANVTAGLGYRYYITAVDTRGNESPPSEILGIVAQ